MILAIDQGTTNTKALLVDESGAVVARASRPLTQSYPQPAWVEQDPLAVWESVRGAMDELPGCRPGADRAFGLAGLGISNQREATLLWERASGRPLGPVIGWQCQRTAPYCAQLRAQGLEPLLHERSA
jgi:glycerol kinase